MDIRDGTTGLSCLILAQTMQVLMNIQLASTELLDGLHASPQHALALHKDIRSRHSLGMHFATFAGSDMEALEPVAELITERERHLGVGDWMEEGGFGVIDIGETAVVAVDRSDSDNGSS